MLAFMQWSGTERVVPISILEGSLYKAIWRECLWLVLLEGIRVFVSVNCERIFYRMLTIACPWTTVHLWWLHDANMSTWGILHHLLINSTTCWDPIQVTESVFCSESLPAQRACHSLPQLCGHPLEKYTQLCIIPIHHQEKGHRSCTSLFIDIIHCCNTLCCYLNNSANQNKFKSSHCFEDCQ